MPFVNVYYPEGLLNKEQLKNASKRLQRSLMDHFKIPENDYFQMYLPYPSDQFYFDPHYLLENGPRRTEKMIHVSITCGPGRTIDQKKGLYQSIALTFHQLLNLSTTDIFITLNETSVENWSFGQGKAQMVTTKGEMNRE